MQRLLKQLVAFSMAAVLVTGIASCGTILYPERKGQIGGRLDPGVAVLDGIGLLLYFIPGVIAFAVDFSNGTIYLPNGRRSQISTGDMNRIVRNGKVDPVVLAQLAYPDDPRPPLSAESIHVRRIDSTEELAEFAYPVRQGL